MTNTQVVVSTIGKVQVTLPNGNTAIAEADLTVVCDEHYEQYEPEYGYDHYLDDFDEESLMVQSYCVDTITGEDYMETFSSSQVDTMIKLIGDYCDYDWVTIDVYQ